jgi:hypothetical protein
MGKGEKETSEQTEMHLSAALPPRKRNVEPHKRAKTSFTMSVKSRAKRLHRRLSLQLISIQTQ